MGAGVGRCLVEADPGDVAVGVGGEGHPEVDRGRVARVDRARGLVPKTLHGQVIEDSGVAGLEAAEAGPVPAELVAVTMKV